MTGTDVAVLPITLSSWKSVPIFRHLVLELAVTGRISTEMLAVIGPASLPEGSKNSCKNFTSVRMCSSPSSAMTACVAAGSVPASGSTPSFASIAAEMASTSTQAALLSTLRSNWADQPRMSSARSYWARLFSLYSVVVAHQQCIYAARARATMPSRSEKSKAPVFSVAAANSAATSSSLCRTTNLPSKYSIKFRTIEIL